MEADELHDDDAIVERLAALGEGEEEAADEEVSRNTSTETEADDEAPAPKKAKGAPGDDEPEEETEAGAISTLEDVARAFEVEPAEFLKSVQVKGADGRMVPLSEVVEHFTSAAATGELPAQLQAKRVEYEQAKARVETEYEQHIGALKAATGEILSKLKTQKNIDWDKLKTEDPMEYVLQRQEHDEQRRAAADGIRQLEDARQRHDREQTQAFETWARDEQIALRKAMPDWADAGKLNVAVDLIAKDLTDRGFDEKDPEIGRLLANHRIMLMAHDAAQWRALKAKGEKAVLAVRKLPRLIKPEQRIEQQSRRTGDFTRARKTLRERGDLGSLADALDALGG